MLKMVVLAIGLSKNLTDREISKKNDFAKSYLNVFVNDTFIIFLKTALVKYIEYIFSFFVKVPIQPSTEPLTIKVENLSMKVSSAYFFHICENE